MKLAWTYLCHARTPWSSLQSAVYSWTATVLWCSAFCRNSLPAVFQDFVQSLHATRCDYGVQLFLGTGKAKLAPLRHRISQVRYLRLHRVEA